MTFTTAANNFFLFPLDSLFKCSKEAFDKYFKRTTVLPLKQRTHTLSLFCLCVLTHTHTHSLYITCACMHPHTPFSYSFIDLAKCFFKFLKLSSDDEKNFFECAIFLLPSFFIALEISNFLNGSSSRGVSHGCRHRDPFFLMASH